MIKQQLLIIMLLSYNTFAFSQKKEIFRDDFDRNYGRWTELEKIENEYFFRNGQYYMINNIKGVMIWTAHDVYIDQKEDFIIETSISLNWDNDGEAVMIFGADKKNSNHHRITIKKQKNKYSLYIGKRIDGKDVGISVETNKTKGFGEPNALTIRKKKNKISFYVNGKRVHTKNFEAFFGKSIGMGCIGPQNVNFDYLVVKQDEQDKNKDYVYSTNRSIRNNTKAKTEIELKKSGGVYEVPVELNGVIKIDFIFDSGASDVSISPDIALALIRTGTIKESDWLSDARYYFADGSSAKSKRFKLKSVKIGDKIVYDVVCSISNSLDAPMLLGQSVLSKFGSYTFDYKKEKLIIE